MGEWRRLRSQPRSTFNVSAPWLLSPPFAHRAGQAQGSTSRALSSRSTKNQDRPPQPRAGHRTHAEAGTVRVARRGLLCDRVPGRDTARPQRQPSSSSTPASPSWAPEAQSWGPSSSTSPTHSPVDGLRSLGSSVAWFPHLHERGQTRCPQGPSSYDPVAPGTPNWVQEGPKVSDPRRHHTPGLRAAAKSRPHPAPCCGPRRGGLNGGVGAGGGGREKDPALAQLPAGVTLKPEGDGCRRPEQPAHKHLSLPGQQHRPTRTGVHACACVCVCVRLPE